jgi:hypothetical protein
MVAASLWYFRPTGEWYNRLSGNPTYRTAMWDDYPQVRSGYRVTIKGDKPC